MSQELKRLPCPPCPICEDGKAKQEPTFLPPPDCALCGRPQPHNSVGKQSLTTELNIPEARKHFEELRHYSGVAAVGREGMAALDALEAVQRENRILKAEADKNEGLMEMQDKAIAALRVDIGWAKAERGSEQKCAEGLFNTNCTLKAELEAARERIVVLEGALNVADGICEELRSRLIKALRSGE